MCSAALALAATILMPTALSARTLSPSSSISQPAKAAGECYGKICSTAASEEYCSPFSERCEKCSDICDQASHNYHESDCQRYCPVYGTEDTLKAEIQAIRDQQYVILVLLIIILVIVAIRYAWKCLKWLKRKRCVTLALKKLSLKKDATMSATNNKEIGTISNVMHSNEMDRAQSQIYSVTGVEGSTMLTVTTPVSTRYPAEDSTTTTPTEYSYDNAALQVTPVSEKPSAKQNVF